MDLTRKQKTIKYLCYCVIILLAHLIQNTAGLMPEIFGSRCFLLIPTAVLLSIGEEEVTASLLGLFAGLLWDTTSVHLGFNCIFFAVICFIISALVNRLLRDTFITNMLMCGVTIILYCVLYWLFFIVLKNIEGAGMTIFSFYLPCGIYTALATFILYIVFKPLKRRLNKK